MPIIIERAMWVLALTLICTSYGLLVLVGLSSWGRTSGLRQGEAGALRHQAASPTGGRTSPITYAPATAGAAITLTGYTTAASGAGSMLIMALYMVGAAVAFSGLWERVTFFRVLPDAMVIRYADRGYFSIPWTECSSVRPPRWPLGGWRVERSDGKARTLMPSDLYRLDWVLHAAIQRAGLRFDGGRWRR